MGVKFAVVGAAAGGDVAADPADHAESAAVVVVAAVGKESGVVVGEKKMTGDEKNVVVEVVVAWSKIQKIDLPRDPMVISFEGKSYAVAVVAVVDAAVEHLYRRNWGLGR